jgi:hypothetical protein
MCGMSDLLMLEQTGLTERVATRNGDWCQIQAETQRTSKLLHQEALDLRVGRDR